MAAIRLGVLLSLLLIPQGQQLIVTDSTLPTLSRSVPLELTILGDNKLTWAKEVWYEGVPLFLRIHLAVVNPETSTTAWFIKVLDANGHQADRIEPKDFDLMPSGAGLWTRLIPGNHARIELHAEAEVKGLVLSLDRYNYQVAELAPKAVVGIDNRQDLVRTYGRKHRYYSYSRPIAILLFQSVYSHKDTNCTGVLLSSSLLLTNQHCISEPWQLRNAISRFDFESDMEAAPEEHELKEIVLSDKNLDFSLLRLSVPVQNRNTVIFSQASLQKDQALLLIQHSAGSPKLISVRDCRVESPDVIGIAGKTDFYHLCDSEGGSSGSAVMDERTGEMVGLHHVGQWDPNSKDYHNLAVRVGLILNAIADRRPEAFKEISQPSSTQHP